MLIILEEVYEDFFFSSSLQIEGDEDDEGDQKVNNLALLKEKLLKTLEALRIVFV